MSNSKQTWIRMMLVLFLLTFRLSAFAAESAGAKPSPTPLQTDTANHADAAQQAQNAKAAQQAVLPFVIQAIGFYTPKCMGGKKSNCGQFGGDSCTCAYLAWKQYYELMNSMAGAQANSEQHAGGGNGGGGSGTPGNPGRTAETGRLAKMMTDAGFKLNPDLSVAAMPNGSAPPNVAGGGGGFSPGDYKPPNFDQKGLAAAGGPTDKAAPGGKGGSSIGDSGGGGGGGGGSGPGSHSPLGGDAGKKGNVSGLSRKFGKDTIGVSGDNIFEMVTRRYKANETKLKK